MPNKGYKQIKEHTEKISKNSAKIWLGKKLSDEHRKKISKAKKGKPSGVLGKHWKIKDTSKMNQWKKGKTWEEIGGIKKAQEWKRKMSEAKRGNVNMLGKHHSEVTKKKIGLILSIINKGKHFSPKTEFKKGHKPSLNRKMPFGKEHWNWKGGVSFNPYPKEFTPELKLKIRTRDNFTCCLCGRTEREELEGLNRVLCVNHIDFNKNNCKENNLNTLCLRCNVKINREREYWEQYFQATI